MVDFEIERRLNFGRVKTDKIYRSAQPNQRFLEYIKKNYKINSIVIVRKNINPEEKDFCQANDISLFRLPIKRWWHWFDSEVIKSFFSILDNHENYPVLIHCWKGKDRTSTMISLYRFRYDGWVLKKIIREMGEWKAGLFWRLSFILFYLLKKHRINGESKISV